MFKFNKTKLLSSVLCFSMILGNIVPVMATTIDIQEINEIGTKETEVLYNKSATYFVTIPKCITLDNNKISSYSVKVEGDIPSDKKVYVSPIDQILQTNNFDFYMQDQSLSNPKDPVVATVTQNKFYWNFQDVANAIEVTDNSIIASGLTSGEWKGIFDFEINMHSINESNENIPLTLSVDGDVVMGTNDTVQVNAYLNGVTVNDKVDWLSDNENIVVTDGLIETKASAKVGDVATITVVSTNSSEVGEIAQTFSDLGLLTIANAEEKVSIEFTVTIIDIEYSTEEINIAPGDSATVMATLLPIGTEGTVSWSQTAISGINLVKNGNEVTIKVAEDMEVGHTYDIIATYGDYSKALKVNIVEKEHTHTYEVSTSKDSTCTEDGYKTYVCECGVSYTDTIDKLGHTYESTIVEPTCTEQGYTLHNCIRCTNSYKNSYIDALGHNYVNNECTRCNEKLELEAGLYDSNGVMLCTWEESGIDATIGYSSSEVSTKTTAPYYVITNKYPTTTKVVLPTTLTNIGNWAFYNCSTLDSVVIQEGTTSLGYGVFRDCTNLTEISIPESVNNIGGHVFSNTPWLTEKQKTSTNRLVIVNDILVDGATITYSSITVPNNIVKIAPYAFQNCSKLTNITLKEGLISIGSYSFYNCTNLTKINIPNGVTTIEDNAFQKCTNLTTVTVPSTVTSMGKYVFDGNEKLTTVTIGSSSIGKYCFRNCYALSDVTILDTVKTIDVHAFAVCKSLKTIYIPSSVTTIITSSSSTVKHYPFTSCMSTLKIYCGASSKPSGWESDWYKCMPYGSTTYVNLSYKFGITRAKYESTYK